mmetsp:Transcript_44522/g.133127  ORF Transcript_44522/g.133127 Transcript_44522/m.133127 type:complete len:232 (-) Transcript_44522:755-1450(-)
MASENHVYMAAVALVALSWAGSFLQLGGVASLQNTCAVDHHLEDNALEPTELFLEQQAAALRAIAQLPAAAQQQQLLGLMIKGYPELLKSVKTASYRTTSQFTLSPDTDCSPYYRYFWVNWCVQVVAMIAATMMLVHKLHPNARSATIGWLATSAVLCIQNIHASWYIYDSHEDDVPTAGYVFLAGCVVSAVFNLILISTLSIPTQPAMVEISSDGSSGRNSLEKPFAAAV